MCFSCVDPRSLEFVLYWVCLTLYSCFYLFFHFCPSSLSQQWLLHGTCSLRREGLTLAVLPINGECECIGACFLSCSLWPAKHLLLVHMMEESTNPSGQLFSLEISLLFHSVLPFPDLAPFYISISISPQWPHNSFLVGFDLVFLFWGGVFFGGATPDNLQCSNNDQTRVSLMQGQHSTCCTITQAQQRIPFIIW